MVVTRTGHRFFNDSELERQFLERIRSAMTEANFWDEFRTTWACLDCELMPWSAKAEEHLSRLRSRALGAKRSLALREFALGIEGLERFVHREPLRRVHECIFWSAGSRERTGRSAALKTPSHAPAKSLQKAMWQKD